MQSNFFQTINALLQQFQQSQPPQNPPQPPQMPSVNALQRQLLQTIQAIDQHTLQQASVSGLFQSLQQQTSQALAPDASISSSQLLYDALQMIAPVGQSPNDEQLLAMALHSGLSQGLDHRRAIETLHGVCLRPHVPRPPLNWGNRSTTMPPIFGRIITSNINLA